MRVGERLLLVVAVLMALFGLVMIFGMSIEIFDRTSKNSVGSIERGDRWTYN